MTRTFAIKISLQVGAWICALIGLFFMSEIAALLLVGSFSLALIPPFIFALVAFMPFVAFILSKEKPPQKLASLSVALIEIVILGVCLWSILF